MGADMGTDLLLLLLDKNSQYGKAIGVQYYQTADVCVH